MPHRAELNGVAADLLSSFVSRNNDLLGYWAIGKLYVRALESGSNDLAIPLIPGPVAANADIITSVASKFGARLLSLIERRRLPTIWIQAAAISLQFDSERGKPTLFSMRRNSRPFHCEIEIVDDLARRHTASFAGWCAPHDPRMETRSVRAEQVAHPDGGPT